jgi:hypothetical protein
MTICEWMDEYSVGVEEIDLQHKKRKADMTQEEHEFDFQ